MAQRRIALVTGGSRGLGRDMVLCLARRGIDVVLTYHTRADLADGVVAEVRQSGARAIALQLDLAQPGSLDAFVVQLRTALREQWDAGAIDYLVNNAGIGAAVPIAQITEALFDTFADIHFKSVVFLTQKCLPLMNDHGGVVFISAAGTRFIVPGYATYAACKSAVETFSRYLAKECGARGIRANVVAPGGIETDFNGGIIRNTPALQQYIRTQTALGRVGRPDDIGAVVAFLCTDEARWINGQRIEVAGGINL